MRSASAYYTDLHAQETGYSGATYHMPSLWRLRALSDWATRVRNEPVRLLDVGCGKGFFMRGG